MTSGAINAVQAAELIRRGLLLADHKVLADIQAECHLVSPRHDPQGWRDIRPMLDQRERSAMATDMAAEALAYARDRGLIEHHPNSAHLVRITRSL